MFELRPYQKQCVNAILRNVSDGNRLLLCVLPMGTGKTVIFTQLAPIVKRQNKKTLIIAHREELLQQAKEKLLKVDSTLKVGIDMADQRPNKEDDVVVASVQSLGNLRSERLSFYNPEEFGLIIIDECHHTAASQYTNILSYFGANKQDGLAARHPVVLGVTATPNRADNVGLDTVFDKVAFKYEMKDAIRDGYLAPVKAYSVFTHEKIKVAVRMGDFATNELSKAVNTEKRNQIVVDSYNEKTLGTLAIAFCVDVQHSFDLSDCFMRNAIPSKAISGKTKPDERKQILEDFRTGKIRVLCNCALLTEGVDIPQIETVLSCSPTKSSVKYMQSIGRGLRLAEGKTHVNILDFVDNISNNTIISASSLIGLDKPIKAKGEKLFDLADKFEELLDNKPGEDISELELSDLDKRIQEVDIFAQAQIPILVQTNSSFAWHHTKDGFKLTLGKDENNIGHFIEIKENVLGKYDVFLKRVESVTPSFMNDYKKSIITTEVEVLNLETKVSALKRGDQIILDKKPDRVTLIRQNARWRQEPPTEKQIEWLEKFGVGNISKLSKGQASILLTKLFSEKKNKK